MLVVESQTQKEQVVEEKTTTVGTTQLMTIIPKRRTVTDRERARQRERL